MKRSRDNDLVAPVAAILALAVCCGAPLALALLLTTGLGAALVAQGWLLAGAGLLAIGLVLGVRYLMRLRGRVGARAVAEDCCAPASPDFRR